MSVFKLTVASYWYTNAFRDKDIGFVRLPWKYYVKSPYVEKRKMIDEGENRALIQKGRN